MITKINLGCGSGARGEVNCGIEGWINIDNDYRIVISKNKLTRELVRLLIKQKIINLPVEILVNPPPNYINMDLLKKKLPFRDNSVDFCYTSHLLEHLPRYESLKLLRNVNKVLKTGGTIRIVVPDLELYVNQYIKAKKGDKNALRWFRNIHWKGINTPLEILNACFWRFPSSDLIYTGFKSPFTRLLKKMLLPDLGHQWMYDFDDLRSLLKESGFGKIRKVAFRKGNTPDINRLDNRGNESLYVEAEKIGNAIKRHEDAQ